MSILIPGMMPKDGECVVVFPGGVVQKYKAGGIAFFEYQDRTEEAVAVQLPPHGRLGDLDAFESIKYELPDGQKAFNRGFHSGVQYVQRLIMDAPTIIPADGGDAQ